MAEAFVATANGAGDKPEKLEDMIEMITFKSNTTNSIEKPETLIGSSSGSIIKSLKIISVGDYSGRWSKGVYIHDYIAGEVSKNPPNQPVIGADLSYKVFHDNSNNEVRLQIWNVAENQRFWPVGRVSARGSTGGIVFSGAGSRSMESAIKWKEHICQERPNIPTVLLVDNTLEENWIGKGLVMNSTEEMDSFCSEHGFVAWFEMLERGPGEKSVFGQAMATLVDEITCESATSAESRIEPRHIQRNICV